MTRTISSLRPYRLALGGVLVTTLAGCASFSPDGGFNPVAEAAKQRLGADLRWNKTDEDRNTARARVAELLASPLTADSAVQVALLSNRSLQASLAELSISEAQLVEASRLPNPTFSGLRAFKTDNGVQEFKIEQALTFNVFSLITMPMASEIERRRFEQTQRAVTLEVLRLASETRKAYFSAIAAEESLRFANRVQQAAQASAELARRMAQVGNFNKLQQAREQSFYADAALGVVRSQQAAASARERLTRMLGLWGAETAYRLPDRLPDLPAQPEDIANVEQVAMAQRLDLQGLKLQTEALARNLGLTKTTRFINVLEIGPAVVKEGRIDSVTKRGYEVSFELPIFDWGTAKVARAEALYLQALDITAAAAIDARSEVREAYLGYRSGYDVARHYRDEIVPLRRRISDENLLRYNGMLIGVFELLADTRSQIASVNSYIEALRDFWIARADLDMALIGKPNLAAAKAMPNGGGEQGSPH